ncbi:MAG: serine hydrolase [Candidatus Hodarchaeota archaeon]
MSLDFEIQNIIKDIPVSFGIAIKNLSSGEEVLLNADRPFQLANVFKIPILVAAMQQIDRGRFHLHDRIVLHDFHKVYPNDILSSMEDGFRLPIKDLLTLITVSDNTAIDMTLDLIGGTQTVNSTMRRLGFSSNEINITTSMHETVEEVFGFSETFLNTSELVKTVMSNGVHFNGRIDNDKSKENMATPRAINRLNEMIFRGNIASHNLCKDALSILLQQTLNTCLQSRFPLDDPNIDIVHNLGTLFGVQNDSGIIYINDNVHLGVTIFTKREGQLSYDEVMSPSFQKVEWQVDMAIRQITRLAYDYWQE